MNQKKMIFVIALSLLPNFTANAADSEESFSGIVPEAKWGALAAGLIKDGAGAAATAGMGMGNSEGDAYMAAMQSCKNSGSRAGVNCQVVSTFSNRCRFLAVGTRSGANYDARYTLSDSRQDAFNRCNQNGYVCNPQPLGRCL